MTEDLMTTSQVMRYIGYDNPRGVVVWLARRGIEPISRQPGRKGENLYLRSKIVEGKESMPGRGERSWRWKK